MLNSYFWTGVDGLQHWSVVSFDYMVDQLEHHSRIVEVWELIHKRSKLTIMSDLERVWGAGDELRSPKRR